MMRPEHLDEIGKYSNEFLPEFKELRIVEIKKRPLYLLYPSYSCVFGGKILLARDWDKWGFTAQCANLIHEVTHVFQWARYENWEWKWLTSKSYRMTFELEAFGREICYWVLKDKIPDIRAGGTPSDLARQSEVLQSIARTLLITYGLKEITTEKWLWQCLATQVIYSLDKRDR